jgi:hypothetical protein
MLARGVITEAEAKRRPGIRLPFDHDDEDNE